MTKLKIGVLGAWRGVFIAKNFMMTGCEIVALCDFNEKRLRDGAAELGGDVVLYDSFDKFIEHDMDAVIVANYFNEHTPFVIECFKRNLHVFCECISNGTMAEGVLLTKAYKDTKSIFFMAENYPQMKFNREMKRICDSGTLGKILYAEGEYNHPGDPMNIEFKKRYNYFPLHWRNYLARTYYITHSLGPIMRATGATPKRVTAFAAFAPTQDDVPTASFVGDMAAIVTTQNDDGSIFRITGCAAFGGHHNAYRICGTNGQIENLRGMGDKVMLRYNAWQLPEGAKEINCYEPAWNDKDENFIVQSGHGGGDYLTARAFIECIEENKEPEHPFNLSAAVAMSSVAILGHRSMLEGGVPYDIPDFENEDDVKKYENDYLTPFYGPDGSAPTLPCCSHPDFKPTEAQLKLYSEALAN